MLVELPSILKWRETVMLVGSPGIPVPSAVRSHGILERNSSSRKAAKSCQILANSNNKPWDSNEKSWNSGCGVLWVWLAISAGISLGVFVLTSSKFLFRPNVPPWISSGVLRRISLSFFFSGIPKSYSKDLSSNTPRSPKGVPLVVPTGIFLQFL